MTQDKNEGSENLNWMEIAETDAINEVRHNGQRLPFVAAAVSLLIIGGGAVFAQTNNESPAQAEETSVSQSSQTPSAVTPSGVPVIPNVAPGVNKYEDDDEYEDDDDDDHKGHGRHGDDDHDDEYEDDEDEDDD